MCAGVYMCVHVCTCVRVCQGIKQYLCMRDNETLKKVILQTLQKFCVICTPNLVCLHMVLCMYVVKRTDGGRVLMI